MKGHVRVGLVRASRRIAGSRGNPGRTLCGATITDRDITDRDFAAIARTKNEERRTNALIGLCASCVRAAFEVRR